MRAVNLIPADQRGGAGPGVGRSGGAAYAVLVLVAGLALLALLYGSARHAISSRRAEAAALTAHAQSAQAAAGQLAPYTSFIALREQRQQAVAQLVDTRFDWAHVLHELGRVLPADTAVSSLTGAVGSSSTSAASPSAGSSSSKGSTAAASSTGASSTGASSTGASAAAGAGSTVTSATPPGAIPTFTLAGCATSQPAVALMLERLRLIDGVKEVTLQSSTKGSSSGGGRGGAGAGGECPPGGPSFAVEVNFDPLPTPTTGASTASSTALTSATGASGAPAGGAR